MALLRRIFFIFIKRDNKTIPDGKTLVGLLSSPDQLSKCIADKMYHIPANQITDPGGIKYIAIYQSKRFFGGNAGIKYYGHVKSVEILPRNKITYIRKNGETPYCLFHIDKWYKLMIPVKPDNSSDKKGITTLYKMRLSRTMSEIWK